MKSLTKVIGLGAGATVAALAIAAMFSGASNAATMRIGICQSATVNGVVDCCSRWVRTPDGRKWMFNGGSCNTHSVSCKSGGNGPQPISYAGVVKPKYCYLKKKFPPLESHDHQPSNPGHNNPNGGTSAAGGPNNGNPNGNPNGNTKP